MNNLFNSSIRQNPNDIIYPTIGMGNFLNNWQNNPELVQKINNSPYNQGYSNEEITNYMGQGLNFGVPEIAEMQRQAGIRTPKTEHELDMANEGIFNIYPTTQNKKIDKSLYLADPTAKNPDANTFINRMKNRIRTAPSRFQEAILGKEVEALQPGSNVVDENGNITLQTGLGTAPRQGGVVNDFRSGYMENASQGFHPTNWGGQKKNWATRLGEGFGSLARFADSSLGRGLIAYGLSNYLGDTNPLEQALSAGVGRQQNRMQDKLYRQRLKDMGYTQDELNSIRGNVTSDVYKNLVNSYKLNNSVKWGDLAEFNPEIKKAIEANPELADSFAPSSVVNQILRMPLTNAQIDKIITDIEYTKGAKTEETKAKTAKTKAETGQVGKPKVTINIKKGGTTSTIKHEGGSGSSKSGGGTPLKVPSLSGGKKEKEYLF